MLEVIVNSSADFKMFLPNREFGLYTTVSPRIVRGSLHFNHFFKKTIDSSGPNCPFAGGGITMATCILATPVSNVPIIPTALARNLSGPLRLSEVQGSPKCG